MNSPPSTRIARGAEKRGHGGTRSCLTEVGYAQLCPAVPAFAPPLDTATSAGRSTRSPIM